MSLALGRVGKMSIKLRLRIYKCITAKPHPYGVMNNVY
jgi:hypothetical protein